MGPMPPADLRYNVSGIQDEKAFDLLGQRSVTELCNALAGIGRSMLQCHRILEWGCGCGRILRHLEFDPSRQEVFGCDIDPKATDWLTRNMPELQVTCNGEYPPLPYPDGHFDLILNHSVLSHLDEHHQDAWLAELRRVLSPDGTLILTVLGAHAHRAWISGLPPDRPDLDKAVEKSRAALDSKGIYFFVDDGWASNFPSYYQSTFHAPWYVFEHWSRFFDIASYIPHGSLDHQDMIVLRHKLPPPPERARAETPAADELSALRLEIAALRGSTSWRLTKPLRDLVRAMRGSPHAGA